MRRQTNPEGDDGPPLLEGIQRKRLRWRSWHRGMKEMDLLLGPFADRHLAGMSAAQLAAYEALLENVDPDLYDWISRRAPVPAERDSDVLRLIIDFHNQDTSG